MVKLDEVVSETKQDPLLIIEKGPKYDGISEGKEISTGEVKWISFLMKPK